MFIEFLRSPLTIKNKTAFLGGQKLTPKAVKDVLTSDIDRSMEGYEKAIAAIVDGTPETLLATIVGAMKPKPRQGSRDLVGLSRFDTESTIIIRDKKSKFDYLRLYNSNTQYHEELTNQALSQSLSSTFFDEEERLAWVAEHTRLVSYVFKQFKPTGLYYDEYGDAFFNKYVPPAYRAMADANQNEYTSAFFAFFEFMFPIEAERVEISFWIGRILTDEYAEEALVMWGRRDIGKTLFAEILGTLTGNYSSSSVPIGKYAAQIAFTKLHFFDEPVHGNKISLERFKGYLSRSDTRKWEEKNEKSFEAPNICNFIVATNTEAMFYIEPEERKFYIPEIAKELFPDYVKRKQKKSKEEARALAEKIMIRLYALHKEDNDDIMAARKYLYEYFVEAKEKYLGGSVHKRMNYHTQSLLKLCLAHESEEIKSLIACPLNEISHRYFRDEWSNRGKRSVEKMNTILAEFHQRYEPFFKGKKLGWIEGEPGSHSWVFHRGEKPEKPAIEEKI